MKYTISLSSDEVLRVIIKHVEDITGLNAVDAKIKLDVDYSGPPTYVLKSIEVEIEKRKMPPQDIRLDEEEEEKYARWHSDNVSDPYRKPVLDEEDEWRYRVWKGIYPKGTK